MSTEIVIRQASRQDSQNFVRIENDAYSQEFLESEDTFLGKLQAFPQGCMMADIMGESVAYLVCHPWLNDDVPPLNCDRFSIPAKADVFFIHSLTIMKRHQHQGLGKALCKAAIQVGRQLEFETFNLVSVQNSQGFWQKCGFKIVEHPSSEVRKKVLGYGKAAHFMVMALKGDRRQSPGPGT